MKRKGLSFGMLLGLFAGGFVLFVVGAVWVISIMNRPPEAASDRTVLRRPATAETVKQDVVTEDMQLRTLQAARTAEDNAIAQRQLVEQTMGQYEDVVIPRLLNNEQSLAAMHQTLINIDNRLASLEGERSGLSVVKPPRSPRRNGNGTTANAVPSNQAAIDPTTTGYTVMAVVGRRAWVTADGRDHTVTNGDRLPVTRQESVPEAPAPNAFGTSDN